MTIASRSSVRGVTTREAVRLGAMHAVSGAVVWSVLGVLARALHGAAALFATVGLVYSATYGFAVLAGRRLPAPSASWQVPATWIRGRGPVGVAGVWSVVLGPGLMTRNPLAGMVLLLVLLPTFEPGLTIVVAGGIGLLHGVGRAAGIIADMRLPGTASVVLYLKGKELTWRRREGVGLLLISGILAGSLFVGHVWRW